MKNIFRKFLFFCLTVLFIQIPAFSEEISELYLIKNSKIQDVKSVTDFYSRQNNLTVKSDATYSTVYITPDDYFITYFEQSGNNVYFYYFAPSKNAYSDKSIISRLKNKNYSCKKEKHNATKQIFYNKVKSIVSTTKLSKNTNQAISEPQTEVYDFSDSAQERYNTINQVLVNRPSQPLQVEPQKIKKEEKEQNKQYNAFVEKDNYVTIPDSKYQNNEEVSLTSSKYDIPAGITMNVVIQSDIETSSLAQNDRISAVLQEDLYVNNTLKAKSGSIVYGNVVEVKSAGGGYKNGALVLQFDTILTTDGDKLTLKTEKCNFTMPNSQRAKKIAGQVTGRAVAGAVTGLLTGLLVAAFSSGTSVAQGIGYGAAIGAGAGMLSGAVTAGTAKGEDVSLAEGTALVLKTVSF